MKDLPRQFLLLTTLFLGLYTSLLGQQEPPVKINSLENHIHSVVKDVQENCRTTESLTEDDFGTLPIGISPGCGGGTTILVVDSAYRVGKGAWFFSLYASVVLPGTTTPLAFAAKNIAFNEGGLSISTGTKLVLVSNHAQDITPNLSLELPADGGNYIEFDCNGFRSINLKGNFVFSGQQLVPDSARAEGKTRVTASFQVNTRDLNNILMAVNITPFKVNGLQNLSFEVKNAVADFSDIANPAGFILPQDYQQQFGSDILLWRGFYLQDVNVEVAGLASDSSKNLQVSAKDLLIDDLGVSGLFSASNVLPDGWANGWPMTIDQLSVKLAFNKLTGGSLTGSLSIPFLDNEPLGYSAIAEQVNNEMNFKFSISIPSAKEFNTPFSGKIRIAEGSIIAIEKRNKKFFPSAVLHGEMSIENSTAKFSGIKFESLRLTSERPFITGGTFSTVSNREGQFRTAGFPVRIDSVNLRIYQGEAAIALAVAFNLMNKDVKAFSAETLIQILARIEEVKNTSASPDDIGINNTRQEWKFSKVKINDVKLEANTTALVLKGVLRIFDDHPLYGNGFMGRLALSIPGIMKNPSKVAAYFGSRETFRYWHLDAYVPTKIPVGPAISIHGLMGGASYHMVRQHPFEPNFGEIDPKKMEGNTALNSEVAYLPDEKAGLSFLAGVTLVVGNENAVNADAMLEINFNEHGGFRYAQFNGTAFFFTGVKNRERSRKGEPVKAPVFASLNMLFDRDNNVFHANLKTYMNVAGVIRGTGPNNLVGEAVIHSDPKDWYVYVGRPSQMFGLDIAHLAIARTYFMIGTKVENVPSPPPEVREVFSDIEQGLMRDENALAKGNGFAAGAHLRIGFDSREKGDKIRPFYVAFTAGAGADVMLRDYGDAYCEGRSGPIGIDGWYASGQAYVFLNGKVGVRVRRRPFDIVRLGAAALLQAKLPNPTWMRGRLGGRYSIFGGLVKGKFNIKFTIGEECELVNPGGELNNINVIADLKPDADAQEVNVFTAPQASFNTSLDTDFTMIDGDDKIVTYRIRLSEFKLMKDKTPVQTKIEWNEAKDVAILRSTETLPQQSTLATYVKLYWEKKSGNTGWQPVKTDNGEIIYEEKETVFTTGTAPSFIPEENVAYSYPIKNQYNFHINEHGAGYVKLRMGQAYLFEPEPDGATWAFNVKFQDSKGAIIEAPLSYDVVKATANFEIPQTLSKQTIYRISFVKHPANTGALDQNVQRNEVSASTGDGNETSVASNTLDGTILQNVEKELYKSAMRTSQFATFAEKWSTFTNQKDQFDIATGNIAVIGTRGSISETFDEVELRGRSGQTRPLVQAVASPDTEWMTNIISPLLYNEYPVDPSVLISWRDPEVLGVKPLKGVKLTNDLGDYRLSDSNVMVGTAPAKSGSILFGYYLSWYGFRDFNDLRNQAASRYLLELSTAPVAVKRLLSARGFTGLLSGTYPVEIIYSLPGTEKVTYRNQITIKL